MALGGGLDESRGRAPRLEAAPRSHLRRNLRRDRHRTRRPEVERRGPGGARRGEAGAGVERLAPRTEQRADERRRVSHGRRGGLRGGLVASQRRVMPARVRWFVGFGGELGSVSDVSHASHASASETRWSNTSAMAAASPHLEAIVAQASRASQYRA